VKRIVVLFLFLSVVAGSGCRPKNRSSVKEEVEFSKDDGWLFDGKSLEGWKIT